MAAKAFSFRSTPSGHVVTQEVESNDLVVYDASGREIHRHKGSAPYQYGTPS